MAIKNNIGDSAKIRKKFETELNSIVSINKKTTQSEQFVGLGKEIYGGEDAASKINSFMNTYDKYWQHATGEDPYTNMIHDRTFHQYTPMTRNLQAMLQPHISGRFILVPARMPRCMEILHPEATKRMRTYIQTCVTAVSGFASKTMEFSTVNTMTEANSYEVAVKQSGVTRSVNLTFSNLFQDLGQYKYITLWMQYIYSQGSGAALYPHYTTLRYHEGNHSMECIYMIVDPSFQVVLEGAILYSMVPKDNQAQTIFDQTWGTHEVPTYQIEFKTQAMYSGMPQVMAICQAVLADYVASTELNDFLVTPDETDDPVNTMGLGENFLHEYGKKELENYVGITQAE